METVKVRPPDPAWQESAEREREELEVSLALWLVASVEHVGSTAVPGLAAKPILELQAAVADLDAAPLIAEHWLRTAGTTSPQNSTSGLGGASSSRCMTSAALRTCT